jgi:hypothetical protein
MVIKADLLPTVVAMDALAVVRCRECLHPILTIQKCTIRTTIWLSMLFCHPSVCSLASVQYFVQSIIHSDPASSLCKTFVMWWSMWGGFCSGNISSSTY